MSTYVLVLFYFYEREERSEMGERKKFCHPVILRLFYFNVHLENLQEKVNIYIYKIDILYLKKVTLTVHLRDAWNSHVSVTCSQ